MVKKGTIVRIRIPKPLFGREKPEKKPREQIGESGESRRGLSRRSFLKRALLFGGAAIAGLKFKKFVDSEAQRVESEVFTPKRSTKNPEFTHLNALAEQVEKALQNILKNPEYTRIALERTAWFNNFISNCARKHEIDASLLYALIAHESRGALNAESRAGARGLAQFIQDTGELYGLRSLEQLVSSKGNILKYRVIGDERFNPVKSIWAAAHHLSDLITYYAQREYLSERQKREEYDARGPDPYAVFFALAAYNAGKNRVDEAINKALEEAMNKARLQASGRKPFRPAASRPTASWSAVAEFLPLETRAYVPLILAKKIILENYGHFSEKHGLAISKDASGAYARLLELSEEKLLSKTSINTFALKHGFKREHLQLLNPELDATVWLNEVYVRVPKKGKLGDFQKTFETFKSLCWNNFKYKGLNESKTRAETACKHITRGVIIKSLSKLVPALPVRLTKFEGFGKRVERRA